MSSSFTLRIVFGLLVLCVFHLFHVDAQILKKILKSSSSSSSSSVSVLRGRVISHPLPALPSTSQNVHTLHRFNPALSPQTSIVRMPNRDIVPSIHRSQSLHSINSGNLPSIMSEITHAEAASVLGSLRLPPPQIVQQGPPIIHRLIPNFNNMRSAGKIMKIGALGLAGTGGALEIIDTVKGDKCCEGKGEQKQEENIMSEKRNDDRKITTTEKSTEFTNRLGMDK